MPTQDLPLFDPWLWITYVRGKATVGIPNYHHSTSHSTSRTAQVSGGKLLVVLSAVVVCCLPAQAPVYQLRRPKLLAGLGSLAPELRSLGADNTGVRGAATTSSPTTLSSIMHYTARNVQASEGELVKALGASEVRCVPFKASLTACHTGMFHLLFYLRLVNGQLRRYERGSCS